MGTKVASAVPPILLTSRDQVRHQVIKSQREGKRVGVVMTMGALHEGHFSLVRRCAEECDVTVVTIFVNPMQFGANEDLKTYPRQLHQDLDSLQPLPVDLVFAPDHSEMFPDGYSTLVSPPHVAGPLEGQCRPGHFRGVATIVLKLLHVVPADTAYFGQKDYQQYLIIKRMAADLDLATTIRVCPIVRTPAGLALSSRNAYLNPQELASALAIYQSLQQAQQLVREGVRHVAEITARMRETLHAGRIDRIDYVAITDCETLEDLRHVDRRAMALVAAHVGTTRLIDNLLLHPR